MTTNRELFITWICDYIICNFKNTKNDAFFYEVSIDEDYLFDWNDIEKELQNEIYKRTRFNFNVTFDRENLELRGGLNKNGGKGNEIQSWR